MTRSARWVPTLVLASLLCLLCLPTLATTGAPTAAPALTPASLNNPSAPASLTLTPGDRRVDISWTASKESTAVGYSVYLDDVLVATTRDPEPRTASVTGLVNGRTYTVAVRTVGSRPLFGDVEGTGDKHADVVPADDVAPAPPTGLTVSEAGNRFLTLSWSASPEYDVDLYRLLRDGTKLVEQTGTTFTDGGRTNDRTYTYTLQARDTSGNWSAVSSPGVVGMPHETVPPAAPTGLAAVRGDGRVTLSWAANTEPDLADYVVRRDGVDIAVVTGRTYIDTTVTNDVTYSYTLVARDGYANRSAPSSPAVSATPTDLTAPVTPTGLTAVRGDEQVTVSWTANPETDVASYRVLRDGVEVATVTAGTTYVDGGLTNDRAYTYRLAAVDTHGNRSPATGPASATPTDLTPPAPPTGLTAVRGDTQVTLSWTAGTEPDLASYRVLRDGVEVATVTGGTTFTDSGRTNDTTYRYALVAVDTHGNRSAPSTPAVSATPTDLAPPATPAQFLAERGDGQVTLSWLPGSEPDLAGYRVLRDGVEVGVVGAADQGWTDTGLTNGRTYRYSLVAVDGHGNRSTPTGTVDATPTDLTAPTVPTGLTAVRGEGRVDLTWTANPEPDLASYRLLRDGAEVAVIPAGATTYADTGLVDDRTYSYRLAAVDNHANRSAPSAAVDATPTDLTPPAAPTGLAAVRGDGQVALSWTANSETDLASYRVLRDGVEVATVTGTSYTDTGLVNDRSYAYRLVAVDTHGNRSVPSAAVSATPTDLTAPAVPTGLAATGGDEQVTLTWTANTEPDLATYRVLRDDIEIATVTGATSYLDTAVVDDTTYAYRLVAVDTHGNRSAPTAPVTATPTDRTPPAVPSGLTAAGGDGRVTLSWTANTEADLASYRVLRDDVEIATVTATSYVDATVVNDTAYTYRLVAVDTHGNRSAPSTAVSATPTDLTAPGTPTGFAAVRGDGRVDLSWAANPEADVVGYRLFRDGVLLTTLTGTTYADTAVTNDVTYTYRLAAVDGHGNPSVATAPVQATPTDLTAPAVPTGLAATGGDGQVSLTWTANTEPDLATYRVLQDGVEVATVTGTTWTASGLTNDQATSFALVAVDTHGNRSAASAPVGATPTDLIAPAAPTGLATDRGDGQVTISWAPSTEPDVVAYRVLRDGVEVATVTGTTYTDTGLTDDTAYRYTVVAVDGHGNASAPSTGVDGTPTDLTAPAAPADLTAQRGDGQVVLGWAAGDEPDLARYAVLRDGVQIATVTGTSFTDTGLANDTTYRYAVVAVDGHDNRSAPSAPVDATPTDLTPPGAPTSPTAAAGEHSVSVTWNAPADGDVVGYRVLSAGAVLASSAGTGVVVTGLTPGTPVDLVVVAVDGHGNVSGVSATVTATPYDHSAPAAPTALVGRAGNTTATVTWTPPTDPDPLTYRVLRDGVQVGTTTGASFSDAGLVNGTSYAYTVQAVDPSGNVSPPSAAVVVVPTVGTVPAQGSGETGALAVSSDGRYVVTGTRARMEASDTNTAYELYRVDRVAGTAVRIAPLPASATAADATNSAAPAISDDGRYLALATTAALVPADTNGRADVYRLDTRTGTWALVSVPVTGRVNATVPGTQLQTASSVYATSPPVVISGDGDLVLFYSARNDLGPADGNGVVDLYAKRLSTGAVTRVSATATGGELIRQVAGPALAITPDGRYALFPATGSGGPVVLYRASLTGGADPVVVSTFGTTPVGVARDTGDVDLSDDGRYVVFSTSAKPAAPTTSWTTQLAYRKDTVTGAVSALGDGQTGAWEHQVSLDPTGRYAFFTTTAALTPGDTNGHTDAFRRDLVTGVLTLVTADVDGRPVTGPTGAVAPTEYGRVLPVTGDLVVLTTSQALLPADTNRLRDLYVKDLVSGVVQSPVA